MILWVFFNLSDSVILFKEYCVSSLNKPRCTVILLLCPFKNFINAVKELLDGKNASVICQC